VNEEGKNERRIEAAVGLEVRTMQDNKIWNKGDEGFWILKF